MLKNKNNEFHLEKDVLIMYFIQDLNTRNQEEEEPSEALKKKNLEKNLGKKAQIQCLWSFDISGVSMSLKVRSKSVGVNNKT